MKLPIPWRQRSPAEPTPAADSPEIDLKLPRECTYRSFDREPGPCPRCGGRLYQRRELYLIATRRGPTLADAFMTSGDFGWFCAICPSVVINSRGVGSMLRYGKPGWDVGSEFTVLGLVDLDAVPPGKRNVPLGEEGNPFPLIKFTHAAGPGRPALSARPASRPPAPQPAPRRKKAKNKRRR